MPELEVQIKEEIQKLLNVGFIKTIQHQNWLANSVCEDEEWTNC